MNRVLLWPVVIIIFLVSIPAQSQKIFFEQLTTAEGLPSDYVNCIFRDNRGFLWVGTDKGACRYDGKNFLYFNTDNGLVSNFVTCFDEDAEGNIWIATMQGVYIFNGQSLTAFSLPGKNNQPVFQLYFNKDSTFFIVTYDGALYYYINTNESPAEYRKCHFINRLDENRFVTGLNTEMYLMEKKNRQLDFKSIFYPTGKYGESLNRANTRSLVFKKGNSILKCDIKDGLLVLQDAFNFQNKLSLPSQFDIKAILTGDGEIFLATVYGLICLDRENRPFFFNAESGLGTNYIRSLYKDRQNKLYIGTYGAGVKLWPAGYLSRYELNGKVTAVFPSGKEVLITTGKKVYSFLPADRQLTNVRLAHTDAHYTCIYSSPQGEVYLGTMNKYYVFRSQADFSGTGNPVWPVHVVYANSGTSGFAAAGSKTFISTFGEGMYVYDGFGRHFDTLHSQVVESAFPIIEFLVPIKTNIAALTYSNGLTLLDTSGSSIQISREDGLLSNTVYSVFQEKDNEIWIGTQAGLNLFDGKSIIKTFSASQGLIGTKVLCIFRDAKNRLWALSDKYLHLVNDDRLRAIRSCPVLFEEKNTINRAAYSKATNTLVIGMTDALLAIDMSRVIPDTMVTTPALFAVKKDTANILQSEINTISLSHPANKILFQFRNRYASITGTHDIYYKLGGFDDDWKPLGKSTEVIYQQLPAGTYYLMAKAINPDGYASQEFRLLSIEVLPPVWQRNWFIAIMSALLLGAFFYIGHLISRKKYKKKLSSLQEEYRLQLERERIARELHDNVGSQLTYLINKIDDDYPVLSEKAEAEKLSTVARNAMRQLRETIWALDKKEVQWDELQNKTRQLMHLYRNKDHFVHMNWKINNQRQQPLNTLEALNVYRIIQEALNNALKYSGANEVTVSVEQLNGSLCVEVADNGKGFDVQHTETGYGLKNMKKRAEEMNAGLEIISNPGDGTRVRLLFS